MKSENKQKTNKISIIYLNDLQNQINTLEKELFSFDNNNSINQEIKVGNLILNKNLEEPLNQNTINVIKTNTIIILIHQNVKTRQKMINYII